MEIYKVGGCVRDRLLGKTSKDRDWVVVGAEAAELEAQGFRRVGKDFPVFLHPQTHEEYALARTERKSGTGYHGFEVCAAKSVTLEQDLARRDITINAIAEALDGTIIDPHNGRADLAAGVLRHVGAAFVEDPLRVLRVARFAARLGFRVAPETMSLMGEIAAGGELLTLSPERVWLELDRALGEAHPDRFLRVLRECGALAVLLPEIDCLFGIPQPAKYHPEIDTGEHICMALVEAARCRANSAVRFAVLVHDLGKGVTEPAILPSHAGHEERGVALVEKLCARLRVPKSHRSLARAVTRYHLKVHRAVELRPQTLLSLLEALDALRRPTRFEDILLACKIDAMGRGGDQQREYRGGDYLRRARACISAVDPQPLSSQGLSGEAFGIELNKLRIAALADLRAAGEFTSSDNG